jgi:hypothetical protein
MSEQRYRTATIVNVTVVAEDNHWVILGFTGTKHNGEWQRTGNRFRLKAYTDWEEANFTFQEYKDQIVRHGSFPKTVPRGLDTYLLP